MQSKDKRPDPGLEKHIPEFLKDRTLELEQLRANLQEQDFESIRRLSHNWKGFSRPFGFVHLESIAINLEKAAKISDSESCQKLIEQAAAYLKKKQESDNL